MQRVLDIGNCSYDQSRLHALLQSSFDVTPVAVDDADQLRRELTVAAPVLIMINRVFDRDGSDGLVLLTELVKDNQFNNIPLMLISNYPEYQARAVAAGAVPGFGKRDLGSPAWVEQLSAYLPLRV